MSFPSINFIRLSNETDWEHSTQYKYIVSKKFLLVIIKENKTGKYMFERCPFGNTPLKDLNEVRKVWEDTVRIVNAGVTFRKTNHGISNNLPCQSWNKVAHVRPHARNANDVTFLPDGRTITKQCFWLIYRGTDETEP